MTRARLTAQLGVRYDFNHDQALASTVVANPLAPAILPAIAFPGADPGVSKYDKAVKLHVPLLDDAGFAALLADGPDAARAVATVTDA